MSLKNQVIKITHPNLDEPVWDGTYGYIPPNDHADHMTEHLAYEYDLDSEEFKIEVYNVSRQDMMIVIDGKEPSSTIDYDVGE
jgi:hypothetical protein